MYIKVGDIIFILWFWVYLDIKYINVIVWVIYWLFLLNIYVKLFLYYIV